jgi:hypothetical protein
MEEINNATTQILNDRQENNVIDTEEKRLEIKYNQKLTPMDYMAIESIRKLKNPFRMIGVNTVMKDLNICKTVAYKLFQREDFPSINIGKSNQVMVLAYMIWKMEKRV